jgi:predicted RNA binding protein YcfA (HicA-like mRNA interferase family)
MSQSPSLTATDFIRVITTLGYQRHRQTGSHAVYKDALGRRVVVPIHPGKVLKFGTLSGMIKDVGLTKEAFFQRLNSL